MKTILRTLGSFVYTTLLVIVYGIVVCWLLSTALVFGDGFWKASMFVVGIVVSITWMSEKGLMYASIPYNWLWNERIVTRLATTIPAVLGAIWVLPAPWRMPFDFTIGDWVISIIWDILCLFFFYNFATMPFVSLDMGRVDGMPTPKHEPKTLMPTPSLDPFINRREAATTNVKSATVTSKPTSVYQPFMCRIGVKTSATERKVRLAQGLKYCEGAITIKGEDDAEHKGWLTGFVDEEGRYECYLVGDTKHLHYATEEELDKAVTIFTPVEPQA